MKARHEAKHAYKPNTQEMTRFQTLRARAKAWLGFRTVERAVEASAEVRQTIPDSAWSREEQDNWVITMPPLPGRQPERVATPGVLTNSGWVSPGELEKAAPGRPQPRGLRVDPHGTLVPDQGRVLGAFPVSEHDGVILAAPGAAAEYGDTSWMEAAPTMGHLIAADEAASPVAPAGVVGVQEAPAAPVATADPGAHIARTANPVTNGTQYGHPN